MNKIYAIASLALIISLIGLLFYLQPIPEIPDYTKVLHLKFDEGNGTIAYDSSVFKNNGTIYGNPLWVDGKYGKAINFDGIDDYVHIPYAKNLWSFSEFTVMAWVKLNDIITNHRILINLIGGNGVEYFALQFWGNQWSFSLDTNSGTRSLYSGFPFPTIDEWVFLTGTWNGNVLSLYTDGVLRSYGALVGALTSSGNILEIGIYNTVSQPFDGVIDEVHIFNRVLSQPEIQAIMNEG